MRQGFITSPNTLSFIHVIPLFVVSSTLSSVLVNAMKYCLWYWIHYIKGLQRELKIQLILPHDG